MAGSVIGVISGLLLVSTGLPDVGETLRRQGLVMDEGLRRAALRHAQDLVRSATPDREAVRAALQAEGISDVQIAPFSAIGREPAALAGEAERFLAGRRGLGLNRFGVAWAEGRERVLVVLFVRRLIEVPPLPATLAHARRVRAVLIEGDDALAYLTRADGFVDRLSVTRRGRALEWVVPALERGTLELVARTARGPEVASLWHFGAPLAPEASRGPPSLAALNRLRAKFEAAPLERSPALEAAAVEHARAVCRLGVAAHVLDGAGPVERARRRGFFGPVLENVAVAPDFARAEENLLASPSHRRNVLDPLATVVGLGVAETDGRACLVQLFGQAPL